MPGHPLAEGHLVQQPHKRGLAGLDLGDLVRPRQDMVAPRRTVGAVALPQAAGGDVRVKRVGSRATRLARGTTLASMPAIVPAERLGAHGVAEAEAVPQRQRRPLVVARQVDASGAPAVGRPPPQVVPTGATSGARGAAAAP